LLFRLARLLLRRAQPDVFGLSIAGGVRPPIGRTIGMRG
jgi:hypothetical protein